MKNKGTLKFIFNNIEGCKYKIAILSVLQILLGVLTVAFSFMLRFVIEDIETKNKDMLLVDVIIIGAIALALIGFQIFYRIYYEVSYSEIENKLKSNLFWKLLTNRYDKVKVTHDEEWIHRLTSDTAVVASSILSILPFLCRMIVQLVLALVAIIVLYWQFGLSLIPFVILVILITYFMRKRLKACHHEVQEKDGKVKVFFSESLQGLSIVHAFAKEDVFSKKSHKNLEEYREARLKRNLFGVFCSIGYIIVYYGFYIAAIIFCGLRIIDNAMTIGLLTALVALLTQLTGPLGNITAIIPKYYSLLASGERLKTEYEPQEHYRSQKDIIEYYAQDFKAIEMRDVSYSYIDKYGNSVDALQMFNLRVNKGEKILIRGHSGGGKTTIFKMLLNLITPLSGEVLLIDKEEQPLTSKYERLFAYVPQDNLLMQGTIKEVVTLFDESVDENRFTEALKLSEASDFVNRLPLKENTYLNEKGSGLSLGEMERIAIARALYSDAPILLLDECSASLDNKTEEKVINHLLELKDKTILLITHHKYARDKFDQVVDFGD